MAKHKTFRKSPVKSIPQKDVLSNNTGWKSMTNWLIVLVMILPMLFSRATMDSNITVRYIFLSWFMLLFVLFFYALRKTKVNFSFPPLVKGVFGLGIAYGLWSFVSMFFAINIAAGYYETARHLLNLVLLFLIMETVNQEESEVLKLCKALVVVSLIQSLVGILQNYELAFIDIPGIAKPYGLMANSNLFGSAQAFVLPFVIFVLYKARKIWKYASIIAIIGIIASVVISRTRSAWLATIAIIMVSFILITLFSPSTRKKWIIGTLIGGLCIVAIVSLLLIAGQESNFSRVVKEKTISLVQPTGDTSTSTSTRLIVWNKSLKLLKDHLLLGVGPGNWKLAIPPYGSEGLNWAYGFYVPDRPHNVYLQTACETGIPGAVLYFGMWILLAIIAFKVILKSRSEDVRVLTILMLAGLTAFATDSMFSFPAERIEHSLYIVLMGGIILGHYANLPETKNEKQKTINKSLFIAILSITLFNLFLGYKKHNFEVHWNLASAYKKENRYQEVISEVEAGRSDFVTIDLIGNPLEIHSSAAYKELKNYNKALEEINIAKRYNPNSARIYNDMGTIYTDLKQYNKAIQCYLHALRFTPKYELILKNLAINYFEVGNNAACIDILTKINIEGDEYLRKLMIEARKRLKQQ